MKDLLQVNHREASGSRWILPKERFNYLMDSSGDVFPINLVSLDGLGSGGPTEASYELGKCLGQGYKALSAATGIPESELRPNMERPRPPRTYIAVEIPRDNKSKTEDRKIHEITVPELGEPDGYFQALSIEAFRGGRRKGAGKADKACHHDRCCWGPKALFSLKSREDWETDVEITVSSPVMKKHVPDFPDERTFPRIKHASIWDFYNHIGFDHKLRGYRDKAGKEIKFSTREDKGPEIC